MSNSGYLFHHFLNEEDLVWLKQFEPFHLNESQLKAVLFTRELGAMDNGTYRSLNGVDTLIASQQLRQLRELELLEIKGKSRATYYVLGDKVSRETSSDRQEFPADRQELSDVLEAKIKAIGQRPRSQKLRNLILELCALYPYTPVDLAQKLPSTNPSNLVRRHLSPMREEGLLSYTIPHMRNHPKQAYQITEKGTQQLRKNQEKRG